MKAECIFWVIVILNVSIDLFISRINNAKNLNDLRIPPSNRLEKLRGSLEGQHSIRINDQWRICFTWQGGDAFEVEITDYH